MRSLLCVAILSLAALALADNSRKLFQVCPVLSYRQSLDFNQNLFVFSPIGGVPEWVEIHFIVDPPTNEQINVRMERRGNDFVYPAPIGLGQNVRYFFTYCFQMKDCDTEPFVASLTPPAVVPQAIQAAPEQVPQHQPQYQPHQEQPVQQYQPHQEQPQPVQQYQPVQAVQQYPTVPAYVQGVGYKQATVYQPVYQQPTGYGYVISREAVGPSPHALGPPPKPRGPVSTTFVSALDLGTYSVSSPYGGYGGYGGGLGYGGGYGGGAYATPIGGAAYVAPIAGYGAGVGGYDNSFSSTYAAAPAAVVGGGGLNSFSSGYSAAAVTPAGGNSFSSGYSAGAPAAVAGGNSFSSTYPSGAPAAIGGGNSYSSGYGANAAVAGGNSFSQQQVLQQAVKSALAQPQGPVGAPIGGGPGIAGPPGPAAPGAPGGF